MKGGNEESEANEVTLPLEPRYKIERQGTAACRLPHVHVQDKESSPDGECVIPFAVGELHYRLPLSARLRLGLAWLRS